MAKESPGSIEDSADVFGLFEIDELYKRYVKLAGLAELSSLAQESFAIESPSWNSPLGLVVQSDKGNAILE